MLLGLAVVISAQGWGRGNMGPRGPGGDPGNRQGRPAPEAVTVSGTLIVANGFPALKSGDVTYLIGGVNRLSGFIDGFKEGAQVTFEGSAITSPRDSNLKFLRPSKLTMNGKDYDLSRPQFFKGSGNFNRNSDGNNGYYSPRKFQQMRPGNPAPMFRGPGRLYERTM